MSKCNFTISICHFFKQRGYAENEHLQNHGTEPRGDVAQVRFASHNNNLRVPRFLTRNTNRGEVPSGAASLRGSSHLTALLSRLILLDKLTRPEKDDLQSRREQSFQHRQP